MLSTQLVPWCSAGIKCSAAVGSTMPMAAKYRSELRVMQHSYPCE